MKSNEIRRLLVAAIISTAVLGFDFIRYKIRQCEWYDKAVLSYSYVLVALVETSIFLSLVAVGVLILRMYDKRALKKRESQERKSFF